MIPIQNKNELVLYTKVQNKQELSYFQTVGCAMAIGMVGGLSATVYYFILEHCLEWIWESNRELWTAFFPEWLPEWNYTWIVASLGGLLVGLCLYFLGLPGEMALVIDKVHSPGRLEPKQTLPMILISLISITSGGSLGPEAPLVQINGSLGSWLGNKLQLSAKTIRILTFCGMSAALGAFFGAPIGGALFALEIPHRRGIEYYEAIVPAIISSIFSLSVFRFGTGLEVGGIYHFENFGVLPSITWLNLLQGLILGAVGACAGILFVAIFRLVKFLIQKLEGNHIILGLLGGLGIGCIGVIFPQTLFFSEQQIQSEVIEAGANLGIAVLLAIALAKILAISLTIHGGFRGGFIFPLFFVGANLGLALAVGIPEIHPTIAMLCCMAGINVAITKTPISTSIILSVLSNTTILPVIAIASFTSFLLTSNISLLKTQRSRTIETVDIGVISKSNSSSPASILASSSL